MAKKHQTISTGWIDLAGIWHDLEKEEEQKKATKAAKAKMDKQAKREAERIAFNASFERHQRISRGEAYEHEYAKCPECLIAGRIDIQQKPFCYRHNWLEEGYDWLYMETPSGRHIIGHRKLGVAPPKREAPPEAVVPKSKPTTQVELKTHEIVFDTKTAKLKDIGETGLRQLAERLGHQFDALRRFENSRQFADLPEATRTVHNESVERVKSKYLMIRDFIQKGEPADGEIEYMVATCNW